MFEYFTPITGTIGGSMIGLSAASLLLLNGDVLGASGIMASIFLNPMKVLTNPTELWKIAFLTSFLVVSTMIPAHLTSDTRSIEDPTVPVPSAFAYALAGFLVGFGTRLGNGCTSGHGVCGLGRLSPRSFIAVLVFMATGITTSILTAPTTTMVSPEYTALLRGRQQQEPSQPFAGNSITIAIVIIFLTLLQRGPNEKKGGGAIIQAIDSNNRKVQGAVVAGGLFAAGLAISGMVIPSKLHGFLNVTTIVNGGTWDPTLATVLGAAVLISFLSYQFVPNFAMTKKLTLNHPLMLVGKAGNTSTNSTTTTTFNVPTNRSIDFNLLLGEALFGIGWGLGLLCPGPALYHVAVGNPMVLYRWMPLFAVGSAMAQWIKDRQQ
jgi:uncharacterized membrane protein YedE/YeeE